MTEEYKEHLKEKKNILDKAVIQMKKEFIGIDSVIDQISKDISSWFYFPEMQDRPVIINLWGLTGIGKTSVVKRFAELIGFNEHYFRFDLGQCTDRGYDLQDSFKDIYENCNGEPFIIGMDEFQLARTINEDKEEIDRASIRALWDLLDSGKFDIIDFSYYMSWFGKIIKKYDLALLNGVEVENGYVVEGEDAYWQFIDPDKKNKDDDEDKADKKEKILFVSDGHLDSIYDMVDHIFLMKNELREKFSNMNGDQTLDYLIYLYKLSLKPRTVDCTKSLVFVMGNLDEVYTMSRNFNPDVNADEFHRRSKEITITQVKEALLNRFRSEQIARLGNNHIIYPAFDSKSFRQIISLELNKIKQRVFDTYKLNLIFDDDIITLIYQEGVYPTQGTRPIFTTIHQIINTRLGLILNEIYLTGFDADTVNVTIDIASSTPEVANLEFVFIKENKKIQTIVDKQSLVLGKLRKEKRNDEQAIVAVHESGHAILSALLMRTIPDVIFSVTADTNSNGFVIYRPEWNYISKKEIVNRLAVSLGGFVAERIIYGDDNVTIGSSSDFSNATQLATYAIYACGMGKYRMSFGNQNMENMPDVIFDNEEEIDKESKELLEKAEKLAETTLINQKLLLLKMADYLSDKRTLEKDQIEDFLKQYAVDFNEDQIIKKADHIFYRNHLKTLVQEIELGK